MASSRIDLRTLRPRRVCLIKPSSLGDVVHALPVLSALRSHWPDAQFSWVINRGLSGLIDGHPDLDAIIPFDRSLAGPGPRGLSFAARFLRTLKRHRFDLTIDLQGLLRSALMTAATGAPVRVGLSDAREGAAFFYSHRIETTETHAVDRLLRIAGSFGADVSSPRFLVPLRDDDRQWAASVLDALPRPRLVLNPGARWETKRWPPAHFAEIARRAVETFGAGIVIVGAPDDRPLADAIQRVLHRLGLSALDLTGQTTLPRLGALAAATDLFLSNDTGPLHLADAVGAPTVAVFTCTDPSRTGPYGPRASVVRTHVWCAGHRVKRCDRMDCMRELSPDRLWPVVSDRLRSILPPVRLAGPMVPTNQPLAEARSRGEESGVSLE